ncbi:MAG TPA: hypothetical protein VGM44_25655 [Polyangiaceae bacterium]
MTSSAPEYRDIEVTPPAGVTLEYPPRAIVRISVRISSRAQALLAVPRIALFVAVLGLMLLSWRYHVFFFFWLFGLPFLRWLRGGPSETSIVVRERELELESRQWPLGPLVLARNEVAKVEIGHGGLTRANQRALVLTLKDKRRGALFVGLSAEQAEFVYGGLQRWLVGDF